MKSKLLSSPIVKFTMTCECCLLDEMLMPVFLVACAPNACKIKTSNRNWKIRKHCQHWNSFHISFRHISNHFRTTDAIKVNLLLAFFLNVPTCHNLSKIIILNYYTIYLVVTPQQYLHLNVLSINAYLAINNKLVDIDKSILTGSL